MYSKMESMTETRTKFAAASPLVAERPLFPELWPDREVRPFKLQLLKWIGNKQRSAAEIVSYFPPTFGTYFEPFLGSGAVLGTLAPHRAVASDALPALIEIWQMLAANPDRLLGSYRHRWEKFQSDPGVYERVKARFNRKANAADLFFLSRACYGGVIRFRKDGYMSTPLGIHAPIAPAAVAKRIRVWRDRTIGATFRCADFAETLSEARSGDLVYCDPPYSDTQAILYGAQSFTLDRLFQAIAKAADRGALVALSIDGHKKSGKKNIDLAIPDRLFKRTVLINTGRSMLRRFQMGGQSLESELVADRLLLTW
jgi:DNA adenine methylase